MRDPKVFRVRGERFSVRFGKSFYVHIEVHFIDGKFLTPSGEELSPHKSTFGDGWHHYNVTGGDLITQILGLNHMSALPGRTSADKLDHLYSYFKVSKEGDLWVLLGKSWGYDRNGSFRAVYNQNLELSSLDVLSEPIMHGI
jgi:hypothetical protein